MSNGKRVIDFITDYKKFEEAMITKEQLAFIRKEGLIPTPINPNTKRPVAVKGHWFYDWKDEEILAAADVGIYHREKTKIKCAAVDPDDKD